MTIKTMGARALAFLLFEGDGSYSRDVVIIPAGTGKVEPGTALGEITANENHFVPSPDAEVAGKEGAEVAKALLAYPVDATDADVEAVVISRLATFKLDEVRFDASVDDAAKTKAKIAQLKAVGLIAR